jgi:hypothetical protein
MNRFPTSHPRSLIFALAGVLLSLSPDPVVAFFIDGDGHYGLIGETRTSPSFSKQTGTYQAIQQSFRLMGEARFNDRSSAFLEFRLFDNPRRAYLGDHGEPRECLDETSVRYSESCTGRHQDSGEPGYQPYTPKVTQIFARYAFDHCLVEAGRRGRDWGLGLLLDSGSDPFETDASVFDGVTCDINVQKSQTLGVSLGYDKLAETGQYVHSGQAGDRNFGANDGADDIDQFFFTIEFDDRRANAGSTFTKHIGIYFAQISSKSFGDGGSNTSIKYLDLYTGFFVGNFALRNEFVIRMGKSSDQAWERYGGFKNSTKDPPVTHKVQSLGLGGNLEYTLSRSGMAVGPKEYRRGSASRHLLFFDYAYAPGDTDGYFKDQPDISADEEERFGNRARIKEDDKVSAMAFHRNYKPALILFNGTPDSDGLFEDGSFSASRVMNASVFDFGYRYESLDTGNFEVKLITASLNSGFPADLKSYYERYPTKVRPAGYYGNPLGYEIDFEYSYAVRNEALMGVAVGAALPGDAWKTSDAGPASSFLLQTYLAFRF